MHTGPALARSVRSSSQTHTGAEKEASSAAIKAASVFIPFALFLFFFIGHSHIEQPIMAQVRGPLAVTEMLSGFAHDLAFFCRLLLTLDFSFCPTPREPNVRKGLRMTGSHGKKSTCSSRGRDHLCSRCHPSHARQRSLFNKQLYSSEPQNSMACACKGAKPRNISWGSKRENQMPKPVPKTQQQVVGPPC